MTISTLLFDDMCIIEALIKLFEQYYGLIDSNVSFVLLLVNYHDNEDI